MIGVLFSCACSTLNGEQKQPGDKITITEETYIYAIWEEIPHECVGVLQSGQAATCTVNGWKDYYRCECGKYYEDENCTKLISDLEAWKVGDGKIVAAHSGTPEWTKTATTHTKKYTCCDTFVVETEAHEWNNGTCSECGYVCLHTSVAVTKKDGQAATCTVNGWKDYYQCACGKYFADEARTTPIADLEAWKVGDGKIVAKHTYGDLIPEDPAVHTQTELKAGMRAHYHCSVCDTYFDSNKNETTAIALTIPAPTHSFGDWIKDNEKHWKVCSCGLKADEHTHNYTDNADMICNDCGYDRTVSHTHGNGVLQSGQAATCTVDGWKDYYRCECGKYYEDENCTKLISDLEAWKVGDGKIVAEHTYGDLIPEDPAVHTQTELKAGMRAHYHCSVCDTYFDSNKNETTIVALTIPAPTHSFGDWIKDNEKHWKVCSCGLKAEEHTHNYTDNADMICNDCGYDRTVPHTCGNGVLQSGQAATCTVNGWKDYFKCSCGKIYADAACTNKITSLEAWKNGDGKIAASHSYGDLVAKVDATCTQTGMEAHYECSVCHTLFDENKAVKTENELTIDIDVNAHTYGAWTSNGDGTHSRVCGINGNHKETVACSGGTATCTEKAVCEVCNTPYGNTTAHEHGSEWHKNADEHWNECACGDKANKAAHADENNDGKCDVCDYAMGNAENPGENIEPEKTGLSGGAIAGIAVGSAAVAGLGGFSLFWFVIKKKKFADLIALFKKK